jgi:anthranilate synthase/aminodeoxychorismate synthase-like glutamine amidotransferase
VILVLDNRDSFVFNLVQYLRETGAEVEVRRAAEIDLRGVRALAPTHVVVGPGPGTPATAGCSEAVVRELSSELPILGVCLGHQAIGTAFGGRVRRARELLHGRTTRVHHDGRGVFRDLPDGFAATRYHSLVVDPEHVPACLEVSARGADGEILGLRHRERPLEGVQFHPESISSEHGRELLGNFLEMGPRGGGSVG